jgi:hypothetical protein
MIHFPLAIEEAIKLTASSFRYYLKLQNHESGAIIFTKKRTNGEQTDFHRIQFSLGWK